MGRSAPTLSSVFAFISKPFAKNFEQGAATTVYCAASPYTENVNYKKRKNIFDTFRKVVFTISIVPLPKKILTNRWAETKPSKMHCGKNQWGLYRSLKEISHHIFKKFIFYKRNDKSLEKSF